MTFNLEINLNDEQLEHIKKIQREDAQYMECEFSVETELEWLAITALNALMKAGKTDGITA